MMPFTDVCKGILIMGSSVAYGQGAASPEDEGWANLLRHEASGSWHVSNRALGGTRTSDWSDILEKDDMELTGFAFVVMSLSLANEGLANASDPLEIAHIEKTLMTGISKISSAIQGRLRAGSRLVVCGPYPNSCYLQPHTAAVHRVREAMRSMFEDKDGVVFVDFWQGNLPHPTNSGGWGDGLERDPSHPNTAGHAEMHRVFVDQMCTRFPDFVETCT